MVATAVFGLGLPVNALVMAMSTSLPHNVLLPCKRGPNDQVRQAVPAATRSARPMTDRCRYSGPNSRHWTAGRPQNRNFEKYRARSARPHTKIAVYTQARVCLIAVLP